MGRAAGETHRPRGVDRAMMGFASLYPSYAAPAQATALASHPGGAVCNNACDRKARARRMSRYLLYVACLPLTRSSAWMSLRTPLPGRWVTVFLGLTPPPPLFPTYGQGTSPRIAPRLCGLQQGMRPQSKRPPRVALAA